MAAEEVHLLDIGTSFELTVYDTVNSVSSIVDISGATSLEVTFLKPDDTTFTKTATLVTDGTDGKMHYITIANDLDQTGGWRIQGKVQLPTGTWHTDISNFIVWDNL